MTRGLALAALCAGALLAPNGVRAYCIIAEDACPGSSANFETFSVCGNASTTSCVGTLDIATVDEVVLLTARVLKYNPVDGFYYDVFLAANVDDGGTTSIHRLRHSSYRGSGMIQWASQQVDMALCGTSSDDDISVFRWSGWTPGTPNTTSWDYGASAYWLELHGRGGSDNLEGNLGHDRLCGGSGDDSGTPTFYSRGLWGGASSDDLDG